MSHRHGQHVQKYVMIDYEWSLWSGNCVPPCVGDVVNLDNALGPSIGLATVRGWRSIDGYAGAVTEPHEPPSWYLQNCLDEVCLPFRPFTLLGVSYGEDLRQD